MIELAIIGAGHSGVLSAILASMITDAKGNPVYNIKLIDKNKEILSGASLIPTRLHLGGEYPKDQQTALACLHGSMIFHQMMPDVVYTGQDGVRYMLSKNSSDQALTDDKSGLDIQTMSDSYKKIQKKYSKYCEELNQYDIENPFGDPENLFRALNEHEYSEMTNVAGGIYANEKSINPVRYGVFLEQLLHVRKNIQIITECEVDKVSRNGDGRWLIENSKSVIIADIIVNASQESERRLRNTSLDQDHNNDPNVHAYLRGMNIVDISKYPHQKQAIFTLMGEDGFMLSPFNEKYGLLYKTGEEYSYVSSMPLKEDTKLPEEWQRAIDRGIDEENLRSSNSLLKTQELLPNIDQVDAVAFKIRPTLSYDTKLSERRDLPLIIDHHGSRIGVVATKMTYCPFKACEVMMHLIKVAKTNDISLSYTEEDIEQLEKVCRKESILLPNFCKLDKRISLDQTYFKRLGLYAIQRNLPTGLAISFTDDAETKKLITVHDMVFVVINGHDISPLDIFFDYKLNEGIHVHAICKDLIYDRQSLTPALPPKTVMCHGTILNLATGKYVSGITEKTRLDRIGGDFGIASRHDKKGILNDEALVVNGIGYYAEHSGRVSTMNEDDGYSFLQVFNNPIFEVNHRELKEVKIRDINHLIELHQQSAGPTTNKTRSFVAIIESTCDTSKTNLANGGTFEVRAISGYRTDGTPFSSLKEIWQSWRRGETVSGHVELIKDLEAHSIIFNDIEKFLIASANGQIIINNNPYREADSKLNVDNAALKIQTAWRSYIEKRNSQNQQNSNNL